MDVMSNEFLDKVDEKGVQTVAKELGWRIPKCVDPTLVPRNKFGAKMEHSINVDYKGEGMSQRAYIKYAYNKYHKEGKK